MLTLLRWVIGLTLGLAVVIVVTRLLASTQPLKKNDLFLTLFTNPDGSPCEKLCLFSIYPNNPKNSEDQKRIEQFAWMSGVKLSNGVLIGWFDVAGKIFTFYADATSVAVYSEVNDEFLPQPTLFSQPTLGDVIATFGSPTFVYMTNGELSFWFEKENLLVFSNERIPLNASITPHLSIDGIMIYSSERTMPTEFQDRPRWRGFVQWRS